MRRETQKSGSAMVCRGMAFACRGLGVSGGGCRGTRNVVPRHKANFRELNFAIFGLCSGGSGDASGVLF